MTLLMQRLVGSGTAKVADQSQSADLLDVPEELNPLQAHRGDAGCRTDDQDGAAGAGAIGEEFPQEVISREVGQAVHAHRGGDQRYVVDDGTDQADDQHDNVLAADAVVQPLRQRAQNVRVFQRCHGKQDADEKDQRTHVDFGQRVGQRQVLLVLVFLVAMDDIADQPEDAEAEQDAHERRQMGDRLEGRYGDQDADAQIEHQVALELGGLDAMIAIVDSRRFNQLPAQDVSGDGQRNDHADQGRQQYRLDDGQRGDLAADPQHRRRHVADRRPGAARIGGNDDDAGEEQAT